LGIVSFLPLLSIGLYATLGAPGLGSQPLQDRLRNPSQDIVILLQKTERHLASNPDDGRGWDVVAPVLLKIGRAEDAEGAYRNAVRLLGPSGPRLEGLSETLMVQSRGSVTEAVRSALHQLLAVEPQNPRARFYLALALEQAGDRAGARHAFEILHANSPEGAPWIPLVEERIAANSGPETTSQTYGKAKLPLVDLADLGLEATLGQRMVNGFVTELNAEPSDLAGWKRLLRSYAVLGEQANATLALKRGLAVFPPLTEKGGELIALGRELGISMEGMTR